MTTTLTARRVGLAQLVLDQASSPDLAPWVRVGLWCWAQADEHGHARAYPGELRTVLGVATSDDVTRAVRLARDHRVIDGCSTSACLVLPGHALAPCEARHRGST